jgi:hypothetical protein
MLAKYNHRLALHIFNSMCIVEDLSCSYVLYACFVPEHAYSMVLRCDALTIAKYWSVALAALSLIGITVACGVTSTQTI